jgi:hypothetical protein
MILPTSFGYTKKVFAFDTASYTCTCTVIKFGTRKATRRRAAFKGTASVISATPLSYDEFLQKVQRVDAPYSWDGVEVWGTTPLKEQIAIADYLEPLLANEPALPSGFDGWWLGGL